MSFLGGVFGGNQPQNYQPASSAINNAQVAGANAINQGYSNAHGEYGTNYYTPYSTTGANANTMYSNALGLNGAGGNAAAVEAFQTNPGYQFAVGQGEQAINRNAQATGFGGSGNQAMALSDYTRNQGDQAYNGWLNNLSGLNNQGFQSAVGQTARQGALAGLDTGQGNALASNDQWQGAQNANIVSQQNAANQATNTANQQGGANLFSTILGGANLAGKIFSDENEKTDIQKVGDAEGTSDSGDKKKISMYAYRYKGDPKSYPKVVGPMAQDIEKIAPSAVKKINGKRVVSTNWLKSLAA